jgi:hypothetical protein
MGTYGRTERVSGLAVFVTTKINRWNSRQRLVHK